MQNLYTEYGETFFKRFRGNFSGIIFDKIKNSLLLFTDHIGIKQIFYFKNDEYFIFSSKIIDILNFCKDKNIAFKLNKDAAYLMLTNSYYFEELTLIQQIKKIPAGTYITYTNDEIKPVQYFRLRIDQKDNENEDTIIERLDELFKNALNNSLEKNREYGYRIWQV